MGTLPFVSRHFGYWKDVKLKRAELGSEGDFSQVVPGNFMCIPVRLMSEDPAMYLKRLRTTRQIMFSYRPFISQVSRVCFLECSFHVSDTEHCLGQAGHWSDRVVSGLPQGPLTSVWLQCSPLLFLFVLHCTA